MRNLRPAYLLLLLAMRVTKIGLPKMLRLFCWTNPWMMGRIHSWLTKGSFSLPSDTSSPPAKTGSVRKAFQRNLSFGWLM